MHQIIELRILLHMPMMEVTMRTKRLLKIQMRFTKDWGLGQRLRRGRKCPNATTTGLSKR